MLANSADAVAPQNHQSFEPRNKRQKVDAGTEVPKLQSLRETPLAADGMFARLANTTNVIHSHCSETAEIVRHPEGRAKEASPNDTVIFQMSEVEQEQRTQEADRSLVRNEFALLNCVSAQRQCWRALGIDHFVDEKGDDGNSRGLQMPIRVCADPQCRLALPYACPAMCHACGFMSH